MSGLAIQYELRPFAQGTSRYAYRGTVTAPIEKRGTKVVVKKFKERYTQNKQDWSVDIKVSKKAQDLAEIFNDVSKTDRPINFKIPWTMSSNGGETVIVEEYLHGEFTKWCSNNGWVNHAKISGSLLAFSHWTWLATNGELLVCDLQGVKDNPKGYWLTDPAINSVSKSYGNTDLGSQGIDLFFSTHRCTDFCRMLGIQGTVPRPTTAMSLLQQLIKASTTYQGELYQMSTAYQNPLLAAFRNN